MDSTTASNGSTDLGTPTSDEWIAVKDRLRELAALSDAKYQSVRESVAEELKIRPAALDGMRNTYRRQQLGDEVEDEKKKQADRLVALALKNTELFHTPDGGGWANVNIEGRRETWFLKSKTFERWLQHQYYEEQKTSPSSDAMSTAIKTLGGLAYYKAPEREVFTRIAGADGRIYLDLADKDCRAIEIDADGWRIITEPPVRFRRVGTMRPLSAPEAGGSVRDLVKFINVTSEEDFVLIVAWLLAALSPDGPYPVLTLHGPPGASKSTLTRMLRALIDPAKPANRQLPKEKDDLFIAATNNLVLPFENVSKLPEWLSDALCALATGGGLGKRTLYTDSDETTFDVQRPIILNGIENFVVRGDLADRAIPLVLDAIAEKDRKTERRFWSEFDQARPKILGALLDLVSTGLRHLPNTTLDQCPRMADFALWVTACEAGDLKWSEVKFIDAYNANRVDASRVVVDDDVVAQVVLKFMTAREKWKGTASELMKELNTTIGEGKPKDWPTRANKLSGKLRALKEHLHKVGIELDFRRAGGEGTKTIELRKDPRPNEVRRLSSGPSGSSVGSKNNGLDTPSLSSSDRQAIVSGSSAGKDAQPPLTTGGRSDDDKPPHDKPLRSQETADPDDPDDKRRTSLGRGSAPEPRCEKCGRPSSHQNGPVVDGRGRKMHAVCRAEWEAQQRKDGLHTPQSELDRRRPS